MNSLADSVSAVVLILMLIAVGYIMGRAGLMKKEHKSFVIKLLVNISVPCMCIHNVFTDFSVELIKSAGALLLTPMLFNIAMILIALAVAKAMKISHRRFGGFVVMCAMSNSLFVGYPVCTELFGIPHEQGIGHGVSRKAPCIRDTPRTGNWTWGIPYARSFSARRARRM